MRGRADFKAGYLARMADGGGDEKIAPTDQFGAETAPRCNPWIKGIRAGYRAAYCKSRKKWGEPRTGLTDFTRFRRTLADVNWF